MIEQYMNDYIKNNLYLISSILFYFLTFVYEILNKIYKIYGSINIFDSKTDISMI